MKRRLNKTSHTLPVIDPTIIGLDGQVICHSDGRLPTDGKAHERMLRVMGSQSSQGTIRVTMMGVIRVWASRISFTAAPIAAIIAPTTK